MNKDENKKAIISMIKAVNDMISANYFGREASLAKTKLEEAMMWLDKCEKIEIKIGTSEGHDVFFKPITH